MAVTRLTLERLVTPVFKENWKALTEKPERYICNEGGSRSSKSYSIIQVLITYCWKNPNLGVTVCSHSLPHLKRGVLRDFLIIMKDWGYYNEDAHNKTDQVYTFPSKSYMEFLGLEESDKARGASRDILFINEANLVNKSVFDQLNMRTKLKVFIDLNPSDFDCWCYSLADGPNAVKIVSTYRNNLSNLSKEQIEVIEGYRTVDPEGIMWKVFGLGQRGTSAEQIYTHWKICKDMPANGDVFYGLDFGYNVPSALVKIVHYEGAMYCDEVLYQTKLTTADLIERMKGFDIGYADIFCDNAEPKTIEEIYKAGFNAKPADKDVTEGIRKVKSFPLFITSRSTNLLKEIGQYKWKVDKDGKVLDEPVKANDHGADAARYAIFTRMIGVTQVWEAF